jgi:cytidylate kinase
MTLSIPVIAIDGPGGSGKGTIAQLLSRKLGWHLLDSGAMYRIVGLAAVKAGIDLDDEAALALLAEQMNVRFCEGQIGEPATVILDNEDISDSVRTEQAGDYASRVAVHGKVRQALVQRQRDFAQAPGLVADGRDMGTVIFADAPLKIYLTASAEARAERRYKQLMKKGESVSLPALLEDVRRRDERDMQRLVAPLKPADDAIQLDSTTMGIEEVLQTVFTLIQTRGLL